MKSVLFITASAAAVGGGLYAGGILSAGEVYNLPVADVRARLITLPLSPEVIAIAGGSDRADVGVDVGSESITWRVPTGGPEGAKFTANFRAEGPARTRVTIDYKVGKSASTFADRLTSTKFLRSYAETSFAEEVDARLDGRPVDQSRARYDFAQRAAADPRQLSELGLASKSIFTDVSSQITENSGPSDETAQSTQSTRESMKTATQPSVDLPDPN